MSGKSAFRPCGLRPSAVVKRVVWAFLVQVDYFRVARHSGAKMVLNSVVDSGCPSLAKSGERSEEENAEGIIAITDDIRFPH
jgi:hypothetical protein